MVKIPLFSDAFGAEAGEIVISNEEIRIRHKDERINAPLSYLTEVTLIDRLALGKVKARIIVYDIIGNKYSFEPIMNESNFHTLRGFIKKI